jgi:HEAT repeat protein
MAVCVIHKEGAMSDSHESAGHHSHADPATIHSLIAQLYDGDGLERDRVRQALVQIGKPAVQALMNLAKDMDHQVRWEAVKALEEIGDPEAAPALVEALEDDDDIQWLAATGLIGIGQQGLPALFHALIHNPRSVRLQHGAHHVLHDLAKGHLHDIVSPVLAAMDSANPNVEAIAAARAALSQLEKL